ncbi:MAG: RidA family protein [Alcaligenaceae bacterium]|jgi:reactive intermediate/imine deaminase|nr:RidA family protein [Alcaligenaceae bacterium]
MTKKIVTSDKAPAALGPYSQAVISTAPATVFISGQLGLDPASGELVSAQFEEQVRQSVANLKAVIEAAGGSLEDIVRVGLYLTDLNNFGIANSVMQELFPEPYPARSTIEVSALPKGAQFEIDAILALSK